MITINVNGFGQGQQWLAGLHTRLTDLTPLYKRLAGTLEAETEANLAAEGRPKWQALAPSTLARRLKSNRGKSVLMMLQDHGILAASISAEHGSDFVVIGAGGAASAYAPAQQFGTTINRAPYSIKVRLRTDAKGNLLRQTKNDKLAVFAKTTHKRARESWHEVKPFTIRIPARPYLPFTGTAEAPELQPQAETSLLATITRYIYDTTD
jgi:phage virion morphogenesis protein